MRERWVGAGLVVALLGTVAFLLFHDFGSEPDPADVATNRAAKTETRTPKPRARRPAATEAPAGGILVLGVDGRPADDGFVLTSATGGPLVKGEWKSLASVPPGGVVAPEAFRKAPLAFVRAVDARSRSPVTPWEPRGVVLRLAEGCVLDGTVVDGADRPLAGAWVNTERGRAVATTDADGRFRLSGFDEGEEVLVRAAVSREAQGSGIVTFGPGEKRRELRIVIASATAAGLLADIRFAAERTSPATLAVTAVGAAQGTGRRGAREERLPEGRSLLVRIPAAKDAPTGAEHDMRVSCRGFRTTTVRRAIPADRLDTVRIDVPEGGVALTGVVLGPKDEPVAGAEIRVQREEGEFDDQVFARSAADGSFPVPQAPARWIAAFVPGRGASPWVRIDEAEGEVVLRLGAGGLVQGTVKKRESGDAATGVPVTLTLGDWVHETHWEAVTDAGGRFSFPAVPIDVPLYLHVKDGGRWSGVGSEQDDMRKSRDRPPAKTVAWNPGLKSAGEVWSRDLTVDEWPGVEVTYLFRVAEGTRLPASISATCEWFHAGGSARNGWEVKLDPAAPVFRRYLRAGTHRSQFRATGFTAASVELEIEGDGPPRTIPVDLRGAGKARVLVRVRREDGAPLGTGAMLRLSHAARGNGRGLGDFAIGADGVADVTDAVYRAPANEGQEFRGAVAGPGLFVQDSYSIARDLSVPLDDLLARLAARPDEDLVLEVTARTHLDVSVRVTSEDSPVAGVVLDPTPAACFAAGSYTSGADGVVVVRLKALRERIESPKLTARAPFEGTWEWDPPFDFEPGARREGDRWVAEMKVRSVRTVRCLLVDRDGRPVAGARLDQGRNGGAAVVTGKDGRFEVATAGSPDDLRVRFPGWWVERAANDEGAAEPRFVAAREREFSVLVRGVPADAERVVVAATATGTQWSTSASGAGEGAERRVAKITAPALPVALTASTADRLWRGTTTVPADATSAEITLSRVADSVLEFRIVYADGTPLVGRRLKIALDGAEFEAATDAAGTARFSAPSGDVQEAVLRSDGLELSDLPRPFAVPQKEPQKVVVRVKLELLLRRKPGAAEAPFPRIDGTAFVRADGTRVASEWSGYGSYPGRETHYFELAGPGSGNFEVRIGDRTWSLPFDAEKPKPLEIVLD